ncbi:hypothetical protein K227x_20540 [Rubripirellula lacrimiformis]|uniref:Uncharacterized protein n=1 Tax=Rubripirellula lacrimiformis TaxID=1930273 RepID=A0A517N950_9BACT|nr:hypothetical protein K227x_20540 [Rubripirellula lacrimiformis]
MLQSRMWLQPPCNGGLTSSTDRKTRLNHPLTARVRHALDCAHLGNAPTDLVTIGQRWTSVPVPFRIQIQRLPNNIGEFP